MIVKGRVLRQIEDMHYMLQHIPSKVSFDLLLSQRYWNASSNQFFLHTCHNPQSLDSLKHITTRLTDKGVGGGRLVLPGRGKDTDGLVVTGETVDTGLDENQAELAVLVVAVALEVLADGDSLYTTS